MKESPSDKYSFCNGLLFVSNRGSIAPMRSGCAMSMASNKSQETECEQSLLSQESDEPDRGKQLSTCAQIEHASTDGLEVVSKDSESTNCGHTSRQEVDANSVDSRSTLVSVLVCDDATDNAQRPALDVGALNRDSTSDTEIGESIQAVEENCQKSFAGISERLVSLEREVLGLGAKIDGIADRPDPTIDVSEQRRVQANFGVVLATVVSRLEVLSENFERTHFDEVRTAFAQFEASLNTLIEGGDRCSGSSTIVDITNELDHLGKQQSSIHAMLQDLTGHLRNVQMASIVTSESSLPSRSSAVFNTVATTILRRLERAVAAIESKNVGFVVDYPCYASAVGLTGHSGGPAIDGNNIEFAFQQSYATQEALPDLFAVAPPTRCSHPIMDPRTILAECLSDYERRKHQENDRS